MAAAESAVSGPIRARAGRWWPIALPCLFGLASIGIGQDANWDLRNYHLYNPWAWWTGRIGVDLAPAGFPSYFNPWLDLPYYWMAGHWPPRAVAFVMGALHGLNLSLLYRIARNVHGASTGRAHALLLAAAGCVSPNFLAELGNTMGDNTTAVLMLSSLALVLRPDDDARVTGPRRVFVAGLVAGFGIGLKLTNAPYGLGLLAAVAARAGSLASRVRATTATAIGLAVGFAITGGYWIVTMWATFGNPLFPQFNHLFGAPLAAAMGIDSKWLPASVLEAALFPYVFTLFPMRIGELPILQVLWPIAYTLVLGLLASRLLRRERRASVATPRDGTTSPLIAYAVVGYLAWMAVFSVERYLIVVELLLPLIVSLALRRWLPARVAGAACAAIAIVSMSLALLRFETWGDADWGPRPYTVDAPPIDGPSRATVLVMAAPVAWMLPFFPDGPVYVSFDTTFPESRVYLERARHTIEARGGGVYAIIPADQRVEFTGLNRLNGWLEAHRTHVDDAACGLARRMLANAPSSDIVFAPHAPAADGRTACRFERDPERYWASHTDNATIAERMARTLATRGYTLDAASCTPHAASIGARPFRYQFCRVAN